jgi:HK97 family phage prohead protease
LLHRLAWEAQRRSTFESTGDHTGREAENGQLARCFDVFEGEPMTLFKSQDSLRFAVPSAVQVKSDASGIITGYASTFGGEPDRHLDVIAPGAFTQSLAEYRADKSVPAMLWSHKQDEPIGRWTSLAEDDHGLLVEGQLNLKTSRGREAFEHLSAGDAGGLSIGFGVPAGGSEYRGDGVTLIKTIALYEISIVAVPANPRARIASVKSISSKAELVDLLRGAGLAKSAASRVAAGGWPALSNADHQKAIDLAAIIDRATAQLRSK